MTRTSRNDIGKIVRDGKAYRALIERVDPWDKIYYHAKGSKKSRSLDLKWEKDSNKKIDYQARI